jgi:hypothetical protein
MSEKKGLSQQAAGEAGRRLYWGWLKARAALEDPNEDPSDATADGFSFMPPLWPAMAKLRQDLQGMDYRLCKHTM